MFSYTIVSNVLNMFNVCRDVRLIFKTKLKLYFIINHESGKGYSWISTTYIINHPAPPTKFCAGYGLADTPLF